MSSHERPNTCSICQQKAFGYNYEVVSCNACKMFFRRCIIEKVDSKCKRTGNCFDGEDLAVTRPRCRSCRLKKCLKMGMRPRFSEEELDPSTPSTSQEVVPHGIVIQEQFDCSLIKSLSDLHKTRTTVYSVININEDPCFLDLVSQGSKLGEYSRPRTIDWESTKRRLKPWGSLGVMITVEVCKTLDAYNELLLNDRILLLKSVAFKSHHLSIAFDSFIRKKGRVLAPNDLEMFPLSFFQNPHIEKVILELLTSPMQPLIDLNISEQEFVLLNMIVVCNPGIAGLSPSGQKILSQHQQRYAKLLLNQCLIRNSAAGPSRFAAILAINSKLDQQVVITQKMDFVLRTHWDPDYYLPNIMYESCRMANCDWVEKRVC